MKIYFFFLFITLNFFNAHAQQKLTLKTTETYLIKFPSTFGEFQHKDEFITWQLDFNNKKITYNNGSLTKTFNFTIVEASKNSTEERNIYNFENSKEALTLIAGSGNYLKIKISSERIPNTNPAEYKSLKVFTNYSIDDFTQLLAD